MRRSHAVRVGSAPRYRSRRPFASRRLRRGGLIGAVAMILGLIASQLATAGAAVAAPCTLADLSWMKGAWRYDAAGDQNEVVWTSASENRLIGAAWSLHTDRPGGVIEASTIQIEGRRVTLHLRHFTSDLGLAREDIDMPMMFTATACAEGSVTFDGQGAARGGHLSYRREGDQLTIVTQLMRQGKPDRVEMAFRKISE